MDERQRQMKELAKKKMEDESALLRLREELGRTLLSREGDTGEMGETYRQHLKDIEDARAQIADIEAKITRAAELGSAISGKEDARKTLIEEMGEGYARLGQLIVENLPASPPETPPGEAHFASPFKAQLDILSPKIKALESKLSELGGSKDENFFAKIGKGAQHVVVRTVLGKNIESLRRICRKAGEAYFDTEEKEYLHGEQAKSLAEQIDTQRRRLAEIDKEIEGLRGQKREIEGKIGTGWSPTRKIQSQEKRITGIQEELRTLYRLFGSQAEDPQSREASLIQEEDLVLINSIKTSKDILKEDGNKIERIEVSLGIEDEQLEIEKMRKNITKTRKQVEELEWTISGLEEKISVREGRIADLHKRLEAIGS